MSSNLHGAVIPVIVSFCLALVITVNCVKFTLIRHQYFDDDPRPQYYKLVVVLMLLETAAYFCMGIGGIFLTTRWRQYLYSYWDKVAFISFVGTAWSCGIINIWLMLIRNKRYRNRLTFHNRKNKPL